MLPLTTLFLVLSVAQPATVIDRISVIVGTHAIKLSDLEQDIRLTDFMNREPLHADAEARRKSAERLIDQTVIRDEIARGGYRRPSDSDAEPLLDEIRRDRFGGSDARLAAELRQYGLTEDELRQRLLWQVTVLSFIDQRFRPGIQVNDSEVRSYYEQHLAELPKEYPGNSSFEALREKIRASIEGEQINNAFDAWLDQARQRTTIRYLQGGFQ